MNNDLKTKIEKYAQKELEDAENALNSIKSKSDIDILKQAQEKSQNLSNKFLYYRGLLNINYTDLKSKKLSLDLEEKIFKLEEQFIENMLTAIE